MDGFTSRDIEHLEPEQRPAHLANAIVFRVTLDDAQTGVAWVAPQDAALIGDRLTTEWVADKLNRRITTRGYGIVKMVATTRYGWQLDDSSG